MLLETQLAIPGPATSHARQKNPIRSIDCRPVKDAPSGHLFTRGHHSPHQQPSSVRHAHVLQDAAAAAADLVSLFIVWPTLPGHQTRVQTVPVPRRVGRSPVLELTA